MKPVICTILFTLSISLYGQETIYGTGPARWTTLGSPVESGDSVFFNITTHTTPDHQAGPLNQYASFFMSFDQDGNLGSTILHPDTNQVPADSVYLNKMGVGVDSNIAFFAYSDAGPLVPRRKAITFGVFDLKNRNIVQQVPLDTTGKLWHHIVTDFAQDSAHLIIGGGVIIDPFSTSIYQKFYSVYDSTLNLLYTKLDTISALGAYNTIEKVGSKFFIIHRNSATVQFEVLNSDLTQDTLIPRPSFYPWPSAPHMRFDITAVPNSNGSGFYMLSFYGTSNYAVVKFKNDYSVASIDSFRIKDPTYGHAGPWKKAFDWNTPDTIYGIAGFWNPFTQDPWAGTDTIGRKEPFRLVQFDTTGTLHWSKIIGRDSAVYFPYQVVATNDGGALVFSWLYDSQYSTQIHSRLSVIKIGADGSVLHDNEYDLPKSGELALYPNPVKEDLHVRLPKEMAAQGDYRIFSMGGGTQLGGRFDPEQAINVEELLPGSYILHLHLDNGLVQSGRFLKK